MRAGGVASATCVRNARAVAKCVPDTVVAFPTGARWCVGVGRGMPAYHQRLTRLPPTATPPGGGSRRRYIPANAMTVYPVVARTSTRETNTAYFFLFLLVVPPLLTAALFRERVPISGRVHFIMVDSEREAELGEGEAAQLLSGQAMLPKEHPVFRAVSAVLTDVVRAAEALLADEEAVAAGVAATAATSGCVACGTLAPAATPGGGAAASAPELTGGVGLRGALAGAWGRVAETMSLAVRRAPRSARNWRLVVVDSTVVNAFAVPGGIVVVTTGLLVSIDKAVRAGSIPSRESALATVVAHEVAHVVARHGVEVLAHMSWQVWAEALAASSPLLPFMFNMLYQLPHSRLKEMEADTIGVSIMAAAGYDPTAAQYWYAHLDGTPAHRAWVSTHPHDVARAENAAAEAARVALRYKAHGTAFRTHAGVEAALATATTRKPAPIT